MTAVSDDRRPDALGLEPAAPAAEGSLSMRRRAFWSFTDQALSSLTNAGLAIVVARSVGQSSFGAFSLALVTFSFVIGIGRAVVSDVFVIKFSDVAARTRRMAAREATGGAVVIGVLAGAVCGLAGLLVPDRETGRALLALGVCLPGLVVQDCFRFVFFAAARPAAAAANDLIWAVIQFAFIGMLITADESSVVLITLAWGGAALIAAMVACRQYAIVPAPGRAVGWFRAHRALNVRMGMDYVLNMGAVNLATYLIGAIVGLVGVGALRAAQVLLGPLQLVSSGVGAFVLPVFSTRAGGGHRLLRPVAAVSVAVTVVAAVWVGLLLLVPTSVGAEILGESWPGARSVMLPSGLTMIIIALTVGPSLALRALRRADLLLRVTLTQSPLLLALGVGGAYVNGAVGAANGFAIAQAVGAAMIWALFLRADSAPRDFLRPQDRSSAA